MEIAISDLSQQSYQFNVVKNNETENFGRHRTASEVTVSKEVLRRILRNFLENLRILAEKIFCVDFLANLINSGPLITNITI